MITRTSAPAFTNKRTRKAVLYAAIPALMPKSICLPDNTKLKKQITYANKRNIPFVVIVGEEEMKANTFTLKNMTTGIQESVDFMSLKSKFKE